jgi:hypothetical protein
VSEHRYELRRGTTPDEPIEMGIWCALGTCAGHRELVMHPAGKTFTGAELFEHMAGHAAQFSGPAEALAAMSRAERTRRPTGIVQLPPDVDRETRIDVKANWEIKIPEQQPRGYALLLIPVGGLLAVAGGILARLLGWSA